MEIISLQSAVSLLYNSLFNNIIIVKGANVVYTILVLKLRTQCKLEQS